MRIIFAGSPDFSATILSSLIPSNDIVAVYTQPDRPKGRGRKLTPTPVKELAELHGLPVHQPTKFTAEQVEIFASYKPDLFLVAAYGIILPKSILAICTPINVHASLLPKYRGASPIQSCILNGDLQTGVSFMRMEPSMDTGPVYCSCTLDLDAEETSTSLTEKLATLSVQKLPELLQNFNSINPSEQEHEQASYCHKISKEDLQLHWHESASYLHNKIRAFADQPGAFFYYKDLRIKVFSASITKNKSLKPGAIFKKGKFVYVSTGSYDLELQTIQIPGKKKTQVDSLPDNFWEL